MEELASALSFISRKSLGIRLSRFMNAFTSALYLAAVGVLAGLVFKFLNLSGRDVVFVFSMTVLAFLLLLQTGFSLAYSYSQLPLAMLGAFSSLSLTMAVATLIFLFQHWWGGSIMVFLTLPLFLLSLLFLAWFFISQQHRHTTHRKFLYGNIVVPFVFVLLLSCIYFAQEDRSQNQNAPVEKDETTISTA